MSSVTITPTVRLATRADRWAICPIECTCFNWERLLFGLWWRVGQRDTCTWVAEADGAIVGYLIAYDKTLNDRALPYVGGVGVRPSHRQHGMGAQLMQAMMQANPQVWLHVRARNQSAIRLYERLGLVHAQTLSRFYGNGEDAFIMARL